VPTKKRGSSREGLRSRSEVAVVNLGPPSLDLPAAVTAAGRILGPRVAFRMTGSGPFLEALRSCAGLRAIRDVGIVGAAGLRGDEREAVRGAVRDGRYSTKPVLEARSLQAALWSAAGPVPTVVAHPLLMVTWHRFDLRYHARTLLAGYPTIISLPGLVEAPAKPKEYYILLSRGAKREELEEQFRGRFLDYGSSLTPYLGNYLAAAGAYYLLGEPFCDFPGCALYDNHWQKELLEAPSRPLCERHMRRLAKA
jgi:hypothetical protein